MTARAILIRATDGPHPSPTFRTLEREHDGIGYSW
jgi:hypothetical protein